jgi:ribonuclease HI
MNTGDLDAAIPRSRTVIDPFVQVHFDGACQPAKGGGIATYGFTVEGAGFHEEGKGLAVPPFSQHATNNVAEYVGAIRAMEWLKDRGFRGTVYLFGDSQLVLRQMKGEYRVRTEHIRAYHELLKRLTAGFEQVKFEWIPREENREADRLSKEALVDHLAQARGWKQGLSQR